MDKKQQDQLWDELSEDYKEDHRHFYEVYKDFAEETCFYTICRQMEKTFGSHNLNPEPPTPKTWENLIGNDKFEEIVSIYVELEDFLINKDMDNKLRNKILATYQIQQLINLSYGGIVSEEEWKTPSEKYVIGCFDGKIKEATKISHYHFIAFHTPEQGEEFMLYESNRQLVQQYYLM